MKEYQPPEIMRENVSFSDILKTKHFNVPLLIFILTYLYGGMFLAPLVVLFLVAVSFWKTGKRSHITSLLLALISKSLVKITVIISAAVITVYSTPIAIAITIAALTLTSLIAPAIYFQLLRKLRSILLTPEIGYISALIAFDLIQMIVMLIYTIVALA